MFPPQYLQIKLLGQHWAVSDTREVSVIYALVELFTDGNIYIMLAIFRAVPVHLTIDIK